MIAVSIIPAVKIATESKKDKSETTLLVAISETATTNIHKDTVKAHTLQCTTVTKS